MIKNNSNNILKNSSNKNNNILNIIKGHNNHFFTIINNPQVNFKDIIGLNNVKEDLKEFTKYIKFPNLYKKNGCELSNGMLFTGYPGTGKTLMAKAFANECNATFLYTNGSSFNEIYVGVGSKRVRELFNYARQNTPCIIFIDEIDALGFSRNSDKGSNEFNITLNALLAEVDGLIESTGIMLIAATNHPKSLDSALTRSGRFDKIIPFDVPNLEERTKLFQLYLNKISLSKKFNMKEDALILAKRTAGLTGADIKNICNQAILNYMKNYKLSKKNKKKLINCNKNKSGCTVKDITEAIDDVSIGVVKRERTMNDRELKQVAYHESGHALVNYLSKNGSVPLKMSIIPRGLGALGFTQPEPEDKRLMFKEEIIVKVCTLLGGRAAEKIKFNHISTGASDDLEKVSNILYRYLVDYSMDEIMYVTNKDIHSEQYKYEINKRISNLINKYYGITCSMLEKNKDLLELLSVKLLEKETLSKKDIIEIVGEDKIGSYPLPELI
jgi:cell division protease FtsH